LGSISNILSLIKEDLYKEKKDSPCLNFFYSSILHYAISLEIASTNNNNESATFENLCRNIPKKFGCRSSIKTILDFGVKDGFFLKETNPKDKKSKLYKFTEKFSLMITAWYLDRKERHAS
jgi:hypothetical protein